MCCCCSFVFLFKQKTAYEMRISDWSSDVCSSDLTPSAWRSTCTATASSRRFAPTFPCWTAIPETLRRLSYRYVSFPCHRLRCLPAGPDRHQCRPRQARRYDRRVDSSSEEHTSELQSLLSISYAVFCLKK